LPVTLTVPLIPITPVTDVVRVTVAPRWPLALAAETGKHKAQNASDKTNTSIKALLNLFIILPPNYLFSKSDV
jgi:hypothetical protein